MNEFVFFRIIKNTNIKIFLIWFYKNILKNFNHFNGSACSFVLGIINLIQNGDLHESEDEAMT